MVADALTKRYGADRGVQEVSFAVGAGEICALLGRNGAGKTTTMRLVLGVSRADAGSARLLGRPVALGADVLSRVGAVIDGPAFLVIGLALALTWLVTSRRDPAA